MFSSCELFYMRNSVKFCGACSFWYRSFYLRAVFSDSLHFQSVLFHPTLFQSARLQLQFTLSSGITREREEILTGKKRDKRPLRMRSFREGQVP